MLLGGFVAILIVSFILSPEEIKVEIIYIVLERGLEQSLENAESDGFMALLDGRINAVGDQIYHSFIRKGSTFEHLFGYRTGIPEDLVLSDIRLLILLYGYIGFFLFLLCTFFFSYGSKVCVYGMTIFAFAFVTMLQRAWMFEQNYIWAMMFMATNVNYMSGYRKT